MKGLRTLITDNRNRILSLLLTLVFVFSVSSVLLPEHIYADSIHSNDVTGGVVPESFYPPKGFIADVTEWTVNDDNISSAASGTGGTFLRISSKSDSVGGELVFDTVYDCLAYKETGIYLRLLGESDYNVTITVDHNMGRSSFSRSVSPGDEYYIFTSLPEKSSYITKISFTAKLIDASKNDSKAKASVILKGASLSKTDHSENISRYSAFDISGLGKDHTVNEGSAITAGPIITGISGKSVAVRVFLSGRLGGVTLSYAEDGENYSVYGSSVITEGRSCYIFTIDSLISGAFYSIEFTGIKDGSVTVSAVDFIPMQNVKTSAFPCSVSKNFYNAESETLNISGSIARDTVIKYIDKSICLYEYSVWQTNFDTILATDPIDTADMSTSFSFSLPVNKDRFPFCAYIIAINDNGNVQPISDPIYPSVGTGHVGANLTNSLYGNTPENAFISGYDNYVIDIDIPSLFLEKSSENSTAFNHHGSSFYINKDIVSDITKKVKFLSAAGVGIIFNVIPKSDISPKNETDCRTIVAAISYLHREFSPFGIRINGISSDPGSDMFTSQLYNKALLLRLCYTASMGTSVIYTDIDTEDNGESSVWFMSRFTKALAVSNLEFILTNISSPSRIDAVADSAADGGYNYGFTVLSENPANTATASADSDRLSRSVSYIYKVTDNIKISSVKNSWEYFKANGSISFDDNNFISLFDFTKSYDTGSFTISPESGGIFTVTNYSLEEFTGISSCRCVKTTLGRTSPVLITTPVSPMMLSDAPLVSFLIQCSSAGKFSLEFVFISGNDRAVFSAEYSGSGIFTPVCDLSTTDIRNKIDRIAIVLTDGDNVELDIATVSATGAVSVKDAAETVYITETEVVTDSPISGTDNMPDRTTLIYASLGAVVFATIIIFAILSIRKS